MKILLEELLKLYPALKKIKGKITDPILSYKISVNLNLLESYMSNVQTPFQIIDKEKNDAKKQNLFKKLNKIPLNIPLLKLNLQNKQILKAVTPLELEVLLTIEDDS
jgi:hypothetical protein